MQKKQPMKTIYKSLLVFIWSIITINGFSQVDTIGKGAKTISINPTQILLGDLSVFNEYRFKDNNSLGISIGINFPVRTRASVAYPWNWQVNDDLYPILIYSGFIVRLYEKIYVGHHQHYISPLVMYKYLYYNHWQFSDRNGNGEDQEAYERSESANVISSQLMYGKETFRKTTLIDFYFGFGFRTRIRDYNTFNCTYHYSGTCTLNPPGIRSRVQYFPELHIGLRLGKRKMVAH